MDAGRRNGTSFFSLLPVTLGLGPEVWRVLSKCHDMRNRTEYEGALDVDERLVSDLISACRKVAEKTDVQGEDTPADFNADGTWNQREGIEERVRQMMEVSIPDEPVRRAALHFLAAAIENADEERSGAWCLRNTGKGLRLMTGRLFACEVARSKMRVSVIGPVSDEVRGTLGSDPETDEECKKLPGGLLITLPVEHASKAQELLSHGFNSFVDMATFRRQVAA